MGKLIDFKDAVNASVLNPEATVAVFYCDGAYENYAEVKARCPKAKLYAITVTGRTGKGIFACDSETGDLPVAQTVSWVDDQLALGASPVVAYANQDRWLNQGLLNDLAKYGSRIERWDADYDGSPNIPSWASAKQYDTGSVDLDVARANFFSGSEPFPEPVAAHGTARAELTVHVGEKTADLHGIPGLMQHWASEAEKLEFLVTLHTGGPQRGQWEIKKVSS